VIRAYVPCLKRRLYNDYKKYSIYKRDTTTNHEPYECFMQKWTKEEEPAITKLMHQLYAEDLGNAPFTDTKAALTFKTLRAHPEKSTVMILELDGSLIGYALLIYFWSNEFGGNLVDIDEFFIKKEHRSKGIGTNFICWLRDTKFHDAVLLQLEVTPSNKKALALYKRLGFRTHKNNTLDLLL
jgi:Acetyltransferases